MFSNMSFSSQDYLSIALRCCCTDAGIPQHPRLGEAGGSWGRDMTWTQTTTKQMQTELFLNETITRTIYLMYFVQTLNWCTGRSRYDFTEKLFVHCPLRGMGHQSLRWEKTIIDTLTIHPYLAEYTGIFHDLACLLGSKPTYRMVSKSLSTASCNMAGEKCHLLIVCPNIH